MTAGDAGANAARRDDPEELGLDVAYYTHLLWRYRLLIALVTLAGGLGGWIVSRATANMYAGTARLTISQTEGSVAAADAVAKYQLQLKEESVLTSALKDLGLDRPPANATAADLRAAVSSRVDTAAGMLLVEANWTDPDVATRIARVVAQKALDAALERQRQSATLSQEVLRGQIDTTARSVAETQSALLDFREKNVAALGPRTVDAFEADRYDSAAVLAEIPAERARLRTSRELLARTPATIFLERSPDKSAKFEETNPVHTAVAGQVADSEARLAALEAKRDFYRTRAAKGSTPKDQEGLAAEMTLTQLQVAAKQAQQTLDQLTDAMLRALKAGASPDVGLQAVSETAAPARRLGRSTSAHVARGVAIGFVLSVLGILFFHGLSTSTFGRRT